MILADILQWLLIIVGAALTLNAHWLAAFALSPGLVGRARRQYESRPVRVTLVGALIAAPLSLGAVVLGKLVPHPLVVMPCIGVLLLLGLIGLIGSTGLVWRIGAGLASPIDGTQPWRAVLRGGIVAVLVCLMPSLGWFVLLPWLLVSGIGAVALAGRAPRTARGSEDSATIATVIAPDRS